MATSETPRDQPWNSRNARRRHLVAILIASRDDFGASPRLLRGVSGDYGASSRVLRVVREHFVANSWTLRGLRSGNDMLT